MIESAIKKQKKIGLNYFFPLPLCITISVLFAFAIARSITYLELNEFHGNMVFCIVNLLTWTIGFFLLRKTAPMPKLVLLASLGVLLSFLLFPLTFAFVTSFSKEFSFPGTIVSIVAPIFIVLMVNSILGVAKREPPSIVCLYFLTMISIYFSSPFVVFFFYYAL